MGAGFNGRRPLGSTLGELLFHSLLGSALPAIISMQAPAGGQGGNASLKKASQAGYTRNYEMQMLAS